MKDKPVPEPVETLRDNWARQQPPPVREGAVIEGLNLSQEKPGTALKNLAGRRLTFRGCNLKNVALDPAWTVEHCQVSQAPLPPPPTERELLIEERDRCVADRDALNQRIAELDDQIAETP